MNDRQDRTLGIFAAVATVIVIILLTVTVFKRPLSVSDTISTSSNIVSAAAYTDNSFVYDNNDALVAVNYTTGKMTDVSPNDTNGGLSNSSSLSVSSNDHYILFHNELAKSGGILDDFLLKDGLPDNVDYWWVFNVQAKVFSPLPQGTILAKFDGNTINTLAQVSDGTETIAQYNPNTLKQIASINIPASSNFFVTPTSYYLETANNDLLATKNGVVNTTILSGVSVVGVTPDGNNIIATTTGSGAHQLIDFNVQKGSKTIIANNVIGQPAWLSSGSTLYTTGNPSQNDNTVSFATYNGVTQKTQSWNISSTLNNDENTPLSSALLLGPTTGVISDSQSNYYLVGNSLASHLKL